MKIMENVNFCLICRKRENLLNVQDEYNNLYVRDDMYEYFGPEMGSAIKETDYFCQSCIISIRKLNKMKFDLIRVVIYGRSDENCTLENLNLPFLNNTDHDKNNDDHYDTEIVEIFEVKEVKKRRGRPPKRSQTSLSMGHPSASVEYPNIDNRPKSSLLERQAEYECGIDGCKMMYHELKFMSFHKQRKHKLIPYLYPCTECNAKFENKNFLDIHLTSEHLEQRICPMCLPGKKPQKFLGITSLNKHIVTAHIKKRGSKKKKQETKSMILDVVSK